MTKELARAVVGLVDYHVGNLRSIENALQHIGARVRRVCAGTDLDDCSHAILPGVGAFGFCAQRLAASGIMPTLEHWTLQQRRPLLGICVGMQLLGDSSEESQGVPGLGWIGGNIERLAVAQGVRVPHVGWNAVQFEYAYGTFAAGAQVDFYFDHSFAYGCPRSGSTAGFATHGARFSAIVQRDNITGVQFHPEKSQAAGLRFLAAFLTQ